MIIYINDKYNNYEDDKSYYCYNFYGDHYCNYYYYDNENNNNINNNDYNNDHHNNYNNSNNNDNITKIVIIIIMIMNVENSTMRTTDLSKVKQ